MEAFAWILLILLGVLGLLGSILPGIPGLPLLLAAVLFHKWILPHGFSWTGISILAALCFLSLIVEFITTVYGAKRWGGASRAGLFGAGLGGIIGIFFGPLGLLLGPVLGAMLGELTEFRSIRETLRSGVGTGLGFGVSFLARATLALASLIVAIYDLCF